MLSSSVGVRRSLCAALVAAGCVMLSACGGGNAAPANAAPAHASSAHSAAAGEASGWQTVATFKGDGGADYKSADFTVPAGKVRVVWTVQPNDVGPVPMMWEIDGTVNGSDLAYGGSSCPACDGQQTYESAHSGRVATT